VAVVVSGCSNSAAEWQIPNQINGVPRVNSSIAIEIQSLLDEAGADASGRKWSVAYYANGDELYRVLVSDSAPNQGLTDDEIRAAITYGDVLFAVEGGFEADPDAVVAETRGAARYVCFAGYAGDQFERGARLDQVSVCMFQGKVLGLLVTQEDLSTEKELLSLMDVTESLESGAL
jgi:hypothetical protein